MRIAVFLHTINYRQLSEDIKHVLLFEVDDQLITAIGEEIMTIRNINYIIIWLISKEVCTIYIDNLDPDAEQVLKAADIQVKPLSDIRNNPVLEAFLINC